jgi:hypothetical protein
VTTGVRTPERLAISAPANGCASSTVHAVRPRPDRCQCLTVIDVADLHADGDGRPADWWIALLRLQKAVLDAAVDPVADAGLELTMLAVDIQEVLQGYDPPHRRPLLSWTQAGPAPEPDDDAGAPVAAWLVVARAAAVLASVRRRVCGADW